MRKLLSERNRWYVLAGLWVVVMILGYGGFVQQSHAAGLGRSGLDNLYLTLQLATLDYGGGSAAINWRLQIARYIAPVMAASTLLLTASLVFREQFERWRVRRWRGHTIVFGLGAIGSRLAIALAAEGHDVVGVDVAGTAGIDELRGHGIPAITGDATDPSVLRAVRPAQAATVVAAHDDDATNVTVATGVNRLEFPGGRPALRCAVHLDQLSLAQLLTTRALLDGGAVRTEFFNVHAAAARSLVDANLPALTGAEPHLVIAGFGRFGTSVAVAAAQRHDHGGPLQLTIVDRGASGKWQALVMQHPGVADRTEVHCLDLDLAAPTHEIASRFLAALADPRPTLVVVATDDESAALTTGLFVHHTIADAHVSVVVRTSSDTGLAAIIGSSDASSAFPGLTVFPFLDRACTADVVELGIREQIARTVHADHLAHGTSPGTGLQRPWEELTDAERESSRASADGIVAGLTAAGYRLVPLARWDAAPPPLPDDVRDKLAETEHERWRAERQAAGWSYGAVRDDARKLNPLLVAWAQLPADIQARNRDAVDVIPAQLTRAGVALVR